MRLVILELYVLDRVAFLILLERKIYDIFKNERGRIKLGLESLLNLLKMQLSYLRENYFLFISQIIIYIIFVL